jgi:hypothetical protein
MGNCALQFRTVMSKQGLQSVQVRVADWEILGKCADEFFSTRIEVVTAAQMALAPIWDKQHIQLLASAEAGPTESQAIRKTDLEALSAWGRATGAATSAVLQCAIRTFSQLPLEKRTQLLVRARKMFPTAKPRQGRGNRKIPA